MKNTRQKILNQSRLLFNEFGYNQVTIRMIAEALGMSSGNLNYHFRKREDILEALYFEMVAVFDQRVQELGQQQISLSLMQSDVEASMERMIDYRFFWSDLHYLLKSSPKIKSHFVAVRAERVNGYQVVFGVLIKQAVLEPASFPQEHFFLGNRMITYSNTWLYASELYSNDNSHIKTTRQATFHLLSMIYPYLTTKGKKQFQLLFKEFF